MVQFSSNILQSPSRLDHFLKGDVQKQEILVQSKKNLRPSYNWNSKWQVVQMSAQSLISVFASLFLLPLKHLSQSLGAKQLAMRCTVLDEYLISSRNFLAGMQKYKKRYLAAAFNSHQLKAQDLYLHPQIPISEISDKKFQQKLFKYAFTSSNKFDSSKVLNFQNEEGVCFGMCEWFAYLLYSTNRYFTDSKKHFIAVGKQFENGAPKQAGLLQTLKFYPDKHHYKIDLTNYASFSQTDFFQDQEKVARKLLNMPPGLYMSGVPQHATVFFKENAKTSYIFDPNIGIVQLKGKERLHHLIGLFNMYCQDPDSKGIFIFYGIHFNNGKTLQYNS